ncbi:MAG: hypothetical protein AB4041_20000, partial [Microcystaceae cyanobacterium]
SRAITKIAKGVARMRWIISPPKDEDIESPQVQKTVKKLTNSLQNPWIGTGASTYFGYIQSVVTDLIRFGESCSEKIVDYQQEDRLFWLVPLPYHLCYFNRGWQPHNSGIEPIVWGPHPDYINNYNHNNNSSYNYYQQRNNYPVIPFYFAEDCVVYNSDCTSFNIVPDSPLKRVYYFLILNEWHNIGRLRRKTVQDATKKEIIALLGENITHEQFEAFKKAWKEKFEKQKEQPIIYGDVKTISLAGKNDAELYPQYTEFLISLMGLGFDLSRRDLNLTETDNRATAGVAATATYQDAILPYALIIEGVINQQAINPIAPGYGYKLVDLEPRSEKEESDRAGNLYKDSCIVTLNEAREAVGYEPVENGDRFFNQQEN